MKPNRQHVHAKYKGHCAYCGCEITVKQMQVDHLIPQHWLTCPDPPTYESVHCHDNYMPACRSCNNFKSTFDLELFRSELEAQIERLRKYKATVNLSERYGLLTFNPKPVVFYFERLTGQELQLTT